VGDRDGGVEQEPCRGVGGDRERDLEQEPRDNRVRNERPRDVPVRGDMADVRV
jgi:hypothetical protein